MSRLAKSRSKVILVVRKFASRRPWTIWVKLLNNSASGSCGEQCAGEDIAAALTATTDAERQLNSL